MTGRLGSDDLVTARTGTWRNLVCNIPLLTRAIGLARDDRISCIQGETPRELQKSFRNLVTALHPSHKGKNFALSALVCVPRSLLSHESKNKKVQNLAHFLLTTSMSKFVESTEKFVESTDHVQALHKGN